MRTRTALLVVAMISICIPSFGQEQLLRTPVQLLEPVTDKSGQVSEALAPDGKKYPVFRLAPDSPLTKSAYQVLETSYAHQVLRLDRYVRNLLVSEHKVQHPETLSGPMYLLLSQEDGGFARLGFWLEDNDHQRRFLPAQFVDLVVDEESIREGDFEEIFSHELGHAILRNVTGGLPNGWSRNMHQGMTITDYPTAFDEGFAEHFQPLVRDATTNPNLRELMRGDSLSDLNLFWLSRVDQQLRTDGVKRNVFIHRRALPSSALDHDADRYRIFVDGETSTAFRQDELLNGQQMLSTEGVISTVFYRLVNDKRLRDHYREGDFYRPFLPTDKLPPNIREIISPYENVNLKLLAALHAANASASSGVSPLVLMLNSYARLFPDEAKAAYDDFLGTTRGVTASQELAGAFESAARFGSRGEIEPFRSATKKAFPLLTQTRDRVVRGELALDANVGPEIWLLNSDFKISRAIWNQQRDTPLTINLNTANDPQLMTIPGIDLAMARKIVAARSTRGFFREIADLQGIVTPELLVRLRSMEESIQSSKPIPRE